MDAPRRNTRLWTIFVEELEGQLGVIEGSLLALERQEPGAAGADVLQAMFRAAHSLKGAARSVGAEAIETACHYLEELFTAVRDGQRALDRDLCSLLLSIVDGIRATIQAPPGPEAGGAGLLDLLNRLQDASAAPMAPPLAPPLAKPAAPQPRTTSAPPEPAPAGAAVRVPATRLDYLLVQSSELTIRDGTARARTLDLLDLQDRFRRWRQGWHSAARQLKRHLAANDSTPHSPRAEGPSARAQGRLLQALDRARGEIDRIDDDLARLARGLSAESRGLSQTIGALDDGIRQARLVPFSEACAGLSRTVRDLTATRAKEVEFVVEGAAIGVDRSVAEGLRTPLMHLVRNAVDHGIEPVTERQALGKPGRGRVTVAARMRGSQLEVRVEDDGRGLDVAALRRQAQHRGLPDAPDGDASHLAFLPGLSAAPEVTRISGRGIGLDAVRATVEALRGTVSVTSQPGGGASFLIALPPTLTTLRALLVSAGGQTYAIDSAQVQTIRRVAPTELRIVAGRTVLPLDGAAIPARPLARILDPGAGSTPPALERIPVVVLGQGQFRVGVMVDELLAEQGVLVKNLGKRLARVRNIAAATALPDGRYALVLNVAEVIESALGADEAPAAPEPVARRRLLVVDDSATTRTLIAGVLETAGYDVAIATDGAEALRLLGERAADLVVADVEMPRMSGLDLTRAIRRDPRLHELPVILLTALATEQDRIRGLEAGADAYLVKSGFDQGQLLSTIAQLL